MNKIEIAIPENVQQITNATTGMIACGVMLASGIVSGAFAAVKYSLGGVCRIATGAVAGAVAGGCAAATAKAAK